MQGNEILLKILDGERVAYLLGLDVGEFHKSHTKPKVKVGTEYVNKGQNVSQVLYSVQALSKALFERMFWWIVARVNKALDTKERRSYFIGVLDIAGFEIFEVCHGYLYSSYLCRYRKISFVKYMKLFQTFYLNPFDVWYSRGILLQSLQM